MNVRVVSERALLVETPPGDDLAASARAARAMARRLRDLADARGLELVPGAASVLLLSAAPIADAEALRALVLSAGAGPPHEDRADARTIHVATTYDGPDLVEVATRTGLSEDEVVRRHAAATYTVAFVGFAPGFPYLVGLPRELELPRLPAPRPRVPKGSVAIAGRFAGIYPFETPGGWNLLGTTDAALFDARRAPPALLAAGDVVRFVPR